LVKDSNANPNYLLFICNQGKSLEIALQAVNKLLSSSEVNWRSLNYVMKHGKNGTAEIAEAALQTDYYQAIKALIPV
jgi:hypothetical protein